MNSKNSNAIYNNKFTNPSKVCLMLTTSEDSNYMLQFLQVELQWILDFNDSALLYLQVAMFAITQDPNPNFSRCSFRGRG
jgi:hypothetical protein